MDTVHTYIIDREDSISKVLENCQLRGGAFAGPVSNNDDLNVNS